MSVVKIAAVTQTLTVNQATLTVTANNATWTAGQSGQSLNGLTITGLVDGDTQTSLFGAAGGFGAVNGATGAGRVIAEFAAQLPLSRVAVAFVVAALVRIALGSATASILTAAALLKGLADQMPGQETLQVLSVRAA